MNAGPNGSVEMVGLIAVVGGIFLAGVLGWNLVRIVELYPED